jgi:hypothetical protein
MVPNNTAESAEAWLLASVIVGFALGGALFITVFTRIRELRLLYVNIVNRASELELAHGQIVEMIKKAREDDSE